MASWTKWYARVRDIPELVPLYGMVGVAVVAAGYTAHRAFVSTAVGNSFDPQTRGDVWKAVDRASQPEVTEAKPSAWANIAKVNAQEGDTGLPKGIFNNKPAT